MAEVRTVVAVWGAAPDAPRTPAEEEVAQQAERQAEQDVARALHHASLAQQAQRRRADLADRVAEAARSAILAGCTIDALLESVQAAATSAAPATDGPFFRRA